jgi:acyl-CoA dehydrogenase
MDFDYSPRTKELRARVDAFMQEHVFTAEARWWAELEANTQAGRRWTPLQVIEDLKPKARAAGLWNLFLPESERGAGLTNQEYAPLAELMGRVPWASEVFNCSAPDTGNMEVLVRYGSPEHQKRWLEPAAQRRDPQRLRDDRAGRGLVRRHQHRGAHRAPGRRLRHQRPQVVDKRCGRPALQDPDLHGQDGPAGAAPLAAVDDPGADGHPGVNILRPLSVIGYDDAPHGHMEVDFVNVRVPARTSCWAKAAVSKLPKAASARVASTTACA